MGRCAAQVARRAERRRARRLGWRGLRFMVYLRLPCRMAWRLKKLPRTAMAASRAIQKRLGLRWL